MLIAVALTLSALLAFWANAHRYFAGSGFGLFDPKVEPAWTTSSGIPLLVIVVIAVLATAVYVSGMFQVISQTRD